MVEDGDRKSILSVRTISVLCLNRTAELSCSSSGSGAEHSDYDDDDLEPQTNGGNRRPAPKRRHRWEPLWWNLRMLKSLDKAAADILTSKDQETVEQKAKVNAG
jgi:hypothetical protein